MKKFWSGSIDTFAFYDHNVVAKETALIGSLYKSADYK
jgi:hypothetical protein